MKRATPNAQEIKRLEERIDAELIKMQASGYWPALSASLFGNNAAKAALLDRHRTAGWRVEEYSDQREGSFVSINHPAAYRHSAKQY
jgi:hypothetical protein